jgi:hypothetical protein
MTEETIPYDRRADHDTRAALMRLRLIEERVAPMLYRHLAVELSGAIDGVVNVIRGKLSPAQACCFEQASAEHQRAITYRLLGRTGDAT